MAYYAIYVTATGELMSQGSIVADPLPANLTAVDIVNPPADNTMWAVASRSFVPRPAPRIISKVDFIQRFTLTERKELFGFTVGPSYTPAVQKNLAAFMRYLDFLDVIPLDDPGIVQGVNYLETVSILPVGGAAKALA